MNKLLKDLIEGNIISGDDVDKLESKDVADLQSLVYFAAERAAAKGEEEMAELCVTQGIGGQKATVRELAIGYAIGKYYELSLKCITQGIGGQRAKIDDLALGRAIGSQDESVLRKSISAVSEMSEDEEYSAPDLEKNWVGRVIQDKDNSEKSFRR